MRHVPAALLATVVTVSSAGLCWASGGTIGHHAAPPEARSLRLGSFKVIALHDGDVVRANEGKTFGLDVGAEAVDDVLRAARAPAGEIAMSHSALMVIAGKRVVLIDTGEGPLVGGALIPSLALAGIKPDQVTDVLITHSHPDHVGGLIGRDGRAAFPNAIIRMSAKEWAFMQGGGRPKTEIVDARSILLEAAPVVAGIRQQVKTFNPGAIVLPGIRSVAIEGHSPGHVGYEITSAGHRIFDVGDVVHSSIVNLAKPDWADGYDQDPRIGAASRRAVLERLSKSGELIFSPHFPFPGLGRIKRSGDGFSWAPVQAGD